MKNAFTKKKTTGSYKSLLFGALFLASSALVYSSWVNAEEEANCIEPAPELSQSSHGPQARDVFFNYESSELRDDAKPVLEENALILHHNPDLLIIIQGEWSANETGGQDLAESRASTVKEFMVNEGVDPNRIVTTVDCTQYAPEISQTEDMSALNSKVHFISIELEEKNFASSSRISLPHKEG